MQYAELARRLSSDDIKDNLSAAGEIRERIEIVHTTEFKNFLSHTFTCFSSILSTRTTPTPSTSTDAGKLRLTTMQILNRLPNNEVLRPFAKDLLDLAMNVLETDYEESALIVLRIIFDLHKNYRPNLSDSVQPFLDFVVSAYSNLENSILESFGDVGIDGDVDGRKFKERNEESVPYLSSKSSFRVLTECPLIVMLLFQLYPKYIQTNIPSLIPKMMSALSLRPSEEAQKENPVRYKELIACQVKSLSFLTYLLRGFSHLMKPHQDKISQSVIALMSTCPSDACTTRKELLVATRHILATDFRDGFFKHADLMFDERMLVGCGRQAKSTLRPLGFSTLADLVHHIRSSLSLPQLHRVINIFSRIIHDSTLPTSIQATSVRLLLNLVDHIFHNQDPDESKGAVLLVMILDTLVQKFGTLRHYVVQVERSEREIKERQIKKEDSKSEELYKTLYDAAPIPISSSPLSPLPQPQTTVPLKTSQLHTSKTQPDSMHDIKSLVKTMLLGLKTVIWCVNNYRIPKEGSRSGLVNTEGEDDGNNGNKDGDGKGDKTTDSGGSKHSSVQGKSKGNNNITSSYPYKFTDYERDLVGKYLVWGLECLTIYKVPAPPKPNAEGKGKRTASKPVQPSSPEELKAIAEYREVLDSFAASFTVLDPYNLRTTVGLHISLLFDALLSDPQIMAFPQNLLVHPQVSQAFAEVVLNFLMTRIDELASDDDENSSGLLIHSKTHPNRSNVQLHSLNSHNSTYSTYANNSPMTLLRLFKVVFSSIGLFPANEAVLRPHLQTLVVSCLRSATQTSSPGNFYYLLRALFRSISGGKFEHSYKELLPLLPTVLNGLHRVHAATEDSNMRDTIVELCLTIPARLSSLLPHLPLLMRLMVHALCSYGDLVNLGLRTLEFWVDNLTPDFLYPVMCQQKDVLTELMTSLCNHLRPAPYPFGMLALRLLGKLGGRNRRFLDEPMNLPIKKPDAWVHPAVSLKCEWSESTDVIVNEDTKTKGSKRQRGFEPMNTEESFSLPLDEAISASVEVLKRVAKAQNLTTPPYPPVEVPDGPTVITPSKTRSSPPLPTDIHEANKSQLENCDLTAYCIEFMETVKTHQAQAALQILKTSLSTMIDTSADFSKPLNLSTGRSAADVIEEADVTDEEDSDGSDNSFPDDDLPSKRVPFLARTREHLAKDRILQEIAEGLLYGSIVKDREISSQCKVLFQGLGNHILLLLASQNHLIARLSNNGSIIDDFRTSPSPPSNSKQQHESPHMGSFRLLSPLHDGADPFVVNNALVSMLCDGNADAKKAAINMLEYLVARAQDMFPSDPTVTVNHLLFEHLLSSLLQACLDKPWNLKSGAYDGIYTLCRTLSLSFAAPFETQIMTAALFILKDSPREVSSAAVEGSLGFLIHMLTFFHGEMIADNEVWIDALALPGLAEVAPKVENATADTAAMAVDGVTDFKPPPPETILMLVNELTSSKHIVRFGARLAIQHISNSLGTPIAALLKVHESHLKKVLFGKSFSTLPLVQQVGITETLTFLVSKAPGMIELDSNVNNTLKAMLNAGSDFEGSGSSENSSANPHASAIFLRGASSLSSSVTGGPTITIQSELPHGIQLRVSAVLFCRALIHNNPIGFFMNDSIKGFPDVRTMAMDLIFRSMVSSHSQAVLASHATLREIVDISEKSLGEIDNNFQTRLGGQNAHGLDSKSKLNIFTKEKLDGYLKPILTKLIDYKNLSLHLSSGMSKLITLLGSRFEQPLANKLLEHLQHFQDSAKLINSNIYRSGEEPLIAASIVNIFQLLPNVHTMLEPLVDVTLALESDLVSFKRFNEAFSPYKVPLTIYLSNHAELATKFFLDHTRLGKTKYSAFFVSMLKLPEAKPIRDYLSSKEGTKLLLGISLGTALAIAKHDDNRPGDDKEGGGTSEEENGKIFDPLKTRHGVPSAPSWGPKHTRSSASQEQLDVKVKAAMEKVEVAKEKHKGMKLALQSAISNASKTNPGDPDTNVRTAQEEERKTKSTLEDAQKAARLANDTLEASKSFALASSTYALICEDKTPPEATVMTLDSLEWMYQGLRIYGILMESDESYVTMSYHEDVFHAMRILWRSKGRQVRLANEEIMLHNFKLESKLLAECLVRFASQHPEDVELLFDLLDVFQHQTVVDFTFVKVFFQHTVSSVLESRHKKSVLHRFFKGLVDKDTSEDEKVHAMQMLILPMLETTLEAEKEMYGFGGLQLPNPTEETKEGNNNSSSGGGGPQKISSNGTESRSDVVDSAIITFFMKDALDTSSSGRGKSGHGERLNIELLKLSTLLIEFMGRELVEHRKELIKFAWNHLKSEDNTSKQWAYVNVCRFISVYETPSKIILQVYVALLRTFQPESKKLVRVALDILVPALPTRLPANDFIKAIKWTKKIMYEEGHALPQLIHMWHIISTHPRIFYTYRSQFVPHIVNSLNKLGLSPNCALENRQLAFSLADLIIQWELERQDKVKRNQEGKGDEMDIVVEEEEKAKDQGGGKKRKATDGKAIMVDSSKMEDEFKLNQAMIELITNFLLRLALHMADSKDEAGRRLSKRAVILFDRALNVFGKMANVRSIYFDKLFALCNEQKIEEMKLRKQAARMRGQPQQQGTGAKHGGKDKVYMVSTESIEAGLDLLNSILDQAPQNTFIMDNAGHVKLILYPAFQAASKPNGTEIRKKLHKFVVKFCLTYDVSNPGEKLISSGFYQYLKEQCEIIMGDAIADKSGAVNSKGGMRGISNIPNFKDSGETDNFEIGRGGGRCAAYFVLRIIEEVGRVNKAFVENFSFAIVRLTQRLTRDHIQAATISTRSMAALMSQMDGSGLQKVLATPTLAIFEEATADDLKEVVPPGSAIRSLMVGVRLLTRTDIFERFGELRKPSFQILSVLLDKSDSVPLLMTVVGIVGRWLLDDRAPLTQKERSSLVWKISSFDRLPEVPAQPLVGMSLKFLVEYYDKNCDKVVKRNGDVEEGGDGMTDDESDKKVDRLNLWPKSSLGKPHTQGLLSADLKIRETFFSLYATQKFVSSKETIEELRKHAKSIGADSIAGAGIIGRTPLDVLTQLLYTDWEGCGSRYWLVACVDLMLATSIHSGGVGDGVEFWLSKPGCEGNGGGRDKQGLSCGEGYDEFKRLLDVERKSKGAGRGRCLAAVRMLAHSNVELSQSLWVSLFTTVWSKLPSDKSRRALVPPLETLLSRPYHRQFLYISRKPGCCDSAGGVSYPRPAQRLNIVTGLLRGVLKLNPMPALNANLMGSLGSNYNAWYDVLPLMEGQIEDAIGEEEKKEWMKATKVLLDKLGETDLSFALAQDMVKTPETKRAFSQEMYGDLNAAVKGYDELINGAVTGGDVGGGVDEMCLWEERWVELNKQLGQWQVLKEYAENTGRAELLMDCSWKLRDWDSVRKMCGNPSVVAALEGGAPKNKLHEIYLSIADGKLNDVEKLCAQCVQLALHNWQLLPPLSTGGEAHVELLRLFHRLVELRESGQIMVEVSTHNRNKTHPNLKNILSTWRDRLPNKWDPLNVFDDLFTWRGHMFAAITSNFSWIEPRTLATLHDRPWTAIRLSKIARKQNVKEVSLNSLSKLYSVSTMDVHDAYEKLREQIIACKSSEVSRKGGLNIVNNTNLDYFSPKQKAELFRLKAEFFSLLGGGEKANKAYCHATQICPGYGKTWLSWGEHCLVLASNVYAGKDDDGGVKDMDIDEKQEDGKADAVREEESQKKELQLKSQAMGCFMESVRCGYDKAKLSLARCLWMVRDEVSEPGILCKTLEEEGVKLPEWVWIPYIPNLLTSLGRVEGKAAKKLLEGVMKRYPQALYYPLRSFYLQRRDVGGGGGKGSSGDAAEDLMNGMRKSHPALWTKLEQVLDELMYRFRPSLEEELLSSIDNLLQGSNRLRRNAEGGGKAGGALPESMATLLARVQSRFFDEGGGGGAGGSNTPRSKGKGKGKKSMIGAGDGQSVGGGISSTSFSDRYGDLFKKHFISPPPKDLDVVVKRLKIWKKRLINYVSSTPSEINLQHVSAPLSQLSCEAPDLWAGACDNRTGKGSNGNNSPGVIEATGGGGKGQAAAAAAAAASAVAAAAALEGGLGGGAAAVEIPGQYNPLRTDGKPSPELHSKLLKFGSKITIVEREGSLLRRIEMRGTDGETHYFLLHFIILHVITSDERLGQIHSFFNKLLKRGNPGARRRHVELQTQPVVALTQTMRLVRDDPRNMSLTEAWEGDGSLERVENMFGSYVRSAGGNDKAKLDAYRRICKENVRDDLVLRHITAKLDGPEALWSFKKTFSLQLGAESCLNYAFSCQNRKPGNLVVNVGNGKINSTFQPNYTLSGMLETKTDIPFRLTRNMTKLVGDVMIRGNFVPAIGSICHCIVEKKELTEAMLGLVLTDDLMSWHVSKSGGKSDEETRKLEEQLKGRTKSNVNSVMERFKHMSLVKSGEEKDDAGGGVVVDSYIIELVEKAKDETKLCKVGEEGFAPWF